MAKTSEISAVRNTAEHELWERKTLKPLDFTGSSLINLSLQSFLYISHPSQRHPISTSLQGMLHFHLSLLCLRGLVMNPVQLSTYAGTRCSLPCACLNKEENIFKYSFFRMS